MLIVQWQHRTMVWDGHEANSSIDAPLSVSATILSSLHQSTYLSLPALVSWTEQYVKLPRPVPQASSRCARSLRRGESVVSVRAVLSSAAISGADG